MKEDNKQMKEDNKQEQSTLTESAPGDVQSNDDTVHLDNKSSIGMLVMADKESAPFHDPPTRDAEQGVQGKEPVGHKRVSSNLSVPFLGSTSSKDQRPISLIGAVYRRSQSGGQPVIRTISAVSPRLEATDDGMVGDDGAATWNDVFRAFCIHNRSEWMKIGLFLLTLLFILYTFLVALDLLGTSFKVVGGCTAGSMLGSETNPMAAVMIGIIATTLLQSSSTTTAIIVSLVSGGLDVKQGIYMIMGANVGTSVTCMLVSLAHMGDGEEFENAFAGSAVLFFFNFMTVIILLPLEITTGYLFEFTKLMLPENVGEGDSWEGPVKKMVSPLVKNIIIANKGLVDDISTGEVESCSSPGIYPTHCIGGVVSYHTCNQTGVIACDTSGSCPFFFQDGASIQDDMVSGWVCLFIALMMLIFCLIGLVTLLRKMLLGASTQILYKATSINPYVAILIGMGVTVLVQSSSITSSTLVPLAGIGVLDLESMFPLVLGADIGTTFTALMAAMVSSKVQALQIALVHLFFNVTGGLIWYPIPFMRRFILRECRFVGRLTHHWRGFPVVFIANMYFVLPLLVLGISSCFEKGTKGFAALGAFLLFLVFAAGVYFCVWWFWRDGKTKLQDYIQRKQRKAAAMEALADDLDYLKVDTEWCKNEIGRIKDFAGHLQTSVRMEEGRPLIIIDTPTEAETVASEDDERLSTYQSCRSKPWKEVLCMGAGSIRSEL